MLIKLCWSPGFSCRVRHIGSTGFSHADRVVDAAVEKKFPGDLGRLSRMSLVEEGFPQQIRMANLAVIGSRKVNGVAELHSQLVQSNLFPDFVEFYGPSKFSNVTNGSTSLSLSQNRLVLMVV